MKYDFQYQSGALSFEPDFGRVIVATDGGFERGYAAGYTEGETTGYTKGQAEGYEAGHDAGYSEGEQTAQAANAVILADCNAVLPTKGASTAETLEQVPHRIGEIDAESGLVWEYVVSMGNVFFGVVFPKDYELVLSVPNMGDSWTYACYNTTNLKRVVISGNNGNSLMTLTYAFRDAHELEEIDLSNYGTTGYVKVSNTKGAFQNCQSLQRIACVLDLSQMTDPLNMFSGCTSLVHVRFKPLTISSSLDFSTSPNLSADSTQSIVDGFADMTGQTAITLTVHKTVGEKMTPTQKATLSAKNVTLAY